MTGFVDAGGTPVVVLPVAGQDWRGVIDTGFNADLELPDALRPHVNARFKGHLFSQLAAGQQTMQPFFAVDFPFDGQVVSAEATFIPGNEILLGTHMLHRYRLEIDFPAGTVVLTRVR